MKARMIEAVKRYALAEKSDPFAFSVAMSAIESGVSGVRADVGDIDPKNRGAGKEAFYDASAVTVTKRLEDGQVFSDGSFEYQMIGWRNRVRP
jgi:hypothetical protein